MAHREQEEELGELALAEIVHQVLLSIGAQAGYVVKLARLLAPQGQHALLHIFRHLCMWHAHMPCRLDTQVLTASS